MEPSHGAYVLASARIARIERLAHIVAAVPTFGLILWRAAVGDVLKWYPWAILWFFLPLAFAFILTRRDFKVRRAALDRLLRSDPVQALPEVLAGLRLGLETQGVTRLGEDFYRLLAVAALGIERYLAKPGEFLQMETLEQVTTGFLPLAGDERVARFLRVAIGLMRRQGHHMGQVRTRARMQLPALPDDIRIELSAYE